MSAIENTNTYIYVSLKENILSKSHSCGQDIDDSSPAEHSYQYHKTSQPYPKEMYRWNFYAQSLKVIKSLQDDHLSDCHDAHDWVLKISYRVQLNFGWLGAM